MNIAKTLGGAAAFNLLAGVVKIFAVEDNLGAQGAHRVYLRGIRSLGYGDDGARLEEPRGVGDRLAMVAGRGGDDSTQPVFLAETAEEVDAPSDLEGSGRLVVLVLDDELGPGEGRELGIGA